VAVTGTATATDPSLHLFHLLHHDRPAPDSGAGLSSSGGPRRPHFPQIVRKGVLQSTSRRTGSTVLRW
jgi:hypothetical protein